MGTDKMKIQKNGEYIELSREQWKGHVAFVNDYPGLVDEILKYTWTCNGKEHPYLRSTKLNVSLHKFVLYFLYGQEPLERMLEKDNIIEHLDNNGLNCTYENLHVISSNLNKAKAFTIDKQKNEYQGIPSFITDVYFSHKEMYYQMQVTFNRDVYFGTINDKWSAIEAFFFQYSNFKDLFIDWLYIYDCREDGTFDINKFHQSKWSLKFRPQINITPEEQDNVFIERNGVRFIILNTDNIERLSFLSKSAYVNLESKKI